VGSQRRLLRDVSHELRSPLARLRVALELARSNAGPDVASSLDRIEVETTRLDQMIGQLLLLERLQAGEHDAEALTFDLSQLVREVVEDAAFEAGPSGAAVELGEAPPLLIDGHPTLLRSAVDNILRNAVRHSPADSVVEVAVSRDERTIEVTVRDSGIGVPDDDLERLFEPFFRVTDSRDRSSGGSGLGLAIARRAIELHGGSLQARNHEGGGLVVTAELPTRIPDGESGLQL
jgi:two-component system sensor histidine kinase CpxA